MTAQNESGQSGDNERRAREAFRSILPPNERARQIMEETNRIKEYELKKLIGEGGFGVVYRAHKPGMEDVAIKVFKWDINADGGLRYEVFQREAQTLIKLENARNIVRVRDFGAYDDSLPYLITSFFDGRDLQKWLRPSGASAVEERLEPHEIRRIMLGVLIALEDVHQLTDKQIIHGDLTPSNILVNRINEKNPEIRVVDWGIARLQKADDDAAQTGAVTHAIMAAQTPKKYASPEMILQQPLTPASDLFQLALVAHELLTGEKYWENGLMASKMPFFNWGIKRALRKALEWDPSKRYKRASRFRFALRHPFASWLLERWYSWIGLFLFVFAVVVSVRNATLSHELSLATSRPATTSEPQALPGPFDNVKQMYNDYFKDPSPRNRDDAETQAQTFLDENKPRDRYPILDRQREKVSEVKDWLELTKTPWGIRLTVARLEAYDRIFVAPWLFHKKDVKLTIGVKQKGSWKEGWPKEPSGKADPTYPLPPDQQSVQLNCTYGDTICIYYSVDGDNEFTREFELLRGKPGWDNLWELKAKAESQGGFVFDKDDYKIKCSFELPPNFRAPPEPE